MEIKYQEEMKSEHNWRHRPRASAINFFKLGHREGTRRARGGQEVIVVNWWRIAFLLQLQACSQLSAGGSGGRDATVETPLCAIDTPVLRPQNKAESITLYRFWCRRCGQGEIKASRDVAGQHASEVLVVWLILVGQGFHMKEEFGHLI